MAAPSTHSATDSHHLPERAEFWQMFIRLLGPEHRFYKLVVIYSLAISLLTLAIPISVQALIDTIANIGIVRAIVVISLILFGLLMVSGVLYALRAYILELFNRRIFIRLATEMAMSAVTARDAGMDDRKRLSLFNRFFDIMTLKKNLPLILTNGFSLLLQSLIGFIVVSLYHLYFFLFALILIALIWVVWKIWGWRAIQTGFALSEAKYETADWLQGLSISLRDFKDTGNVEYILEEFNDVVNHHVDQQEKHFSFNYRQLLSFLLINALASSALLGMGGWLVIQGELTLGQLVAAELIMLGIFAGLPMLAGYLEYFYDVCAAVEEISRFRTLPQENVRLEQSRILNVEGASIRFDRASFGKLGSEQEVCLDFSLAPREILRIQCPDARVRSLIKNAMAGNIHPPRGEVYFGNLATREINAFELRKKIKVFDRASVVPGSIRHYLMFSNPTASQHDIREALALVELEDDIDAMPRGLDTYMSGDGFPLSLEQTLALKLAAMYLSRPKVMVLKHITDLVQPNIVQNLMQAIQGYGGAVMYITQLTEFTCFTRELDMSAILVGKP
ncbi:MAG: hypothetical protein ACO3R5_10890 [Pseudohongiellaceae bacterium]